MTKYNILHSKNKCDLTIKIFTRSQNIYLYKAAQNLITLPYTRTRYTHTTADGYIFKILEDSTCDIAINIDEDAFVINNKAILSLINYIISNNIACCGMPDGGMVKIRSLNPIVVNPMFCIFNLKEIRQNYNQQEIANFNYSKHKDSLIERYPKELLNFNNNRFDLNNYEPYYPFFLWLASKHKILYLKAFTHSDKISTCLLNHEGTPILIHSWYSREYDMDTYHTNRINNLINLAYKQTHRCFFLKKYYQLLRLFEIMQDYPEVAEQNWWLRHLSKPPKHYINKLLKRT